MHTGPLVDLIVFLLGLVGAYLLLVRPRLIRWGATDDEIKRPYPGAQLIPGGARSSTTMAITIDAPPAAVWPWLVQMGVDRAVWYTWWEVAALEPEQFLGLRMSLDLRGRRFDPKRRPLRFYTDSLWAFQLVELPGGRTRLIVSGYWAFRPRWMRPIVGVLLLEPSTWIMQARQLTGIKRRAERTARDPQS